MTMHHPGAYVCDKLNMKVRHILISWDQYEEEMGPPKKDEDAQADLK